MLVYCRCFGRQAVFSGLAAVPVTTGVEMLPHPLLLLASCLAPLAAGGRYCQPGDSCWPSPDQVEEFAASCNISYRHSEHSSLLEIQSLGKIIPEMIIL